MATEIVKESLAETFRQCVQRTLEEHCSVIFTKDAKVEMQDIIEYESRMRIFGLEKFNDICYISLVNLYGDPVALQQKKTCGAILVYVREESAEKLFKALMKGQTGEDEELLTENTQTLCRRLFEAFQKKANQFGYANLLAGEPENYQSNIEEGVAFPYEEDTLYQVNCTLWREKVCVAELVLSPARNG